MRVDPRDGRCRLCGDALDILEADDATMTVQCVQCGDVYLVEPDAFGDGAIVYYPIVLERQLRDPESVDDG